MKQYFIIISIQLLLFSYTNAQFVNEFGLKSGFSISDIEWSNNFSPEMEQRYGTSTFIYASFATHKYWNLSANIGYIQKGCMLHKVMTDVEGDIIVDETEINSLDFLHFSTKINLFYKIKSFKPTLSLGPSFEYLSFYNGIYEYYEKGSIKDIHYNADISFSLAYEFKSFIPFFQITKQIELSQIIETQYFDIKINSILINFGVGIKI